MTTDDLPPTISVPEAADLLGVSSWTLYKAIREDASPIKILRIGRKIVVPTAPLLEQLGIHPNDDRGMT